MFVFGVLVLFVLTAVVDMKMDGGWMGQDGSRELVTIFHISEFEQSWLGPKRPMIIASL